MKNFETWLNESAHKYDTSTPLKILKDPYKENRYYTTVSSHSGKFSKDEICYFTGTIIIKGYPKVLAGLPGRNDAPKYPFTVYVEIPGVGGSHLTGDRILPEDEEKACIEVFNKYLVTQDSSSAIKEMSDIIKRYSDANARKWNTEVASKKFGL